jgi:hypothetical protein
VKACLRQAGQRYKTRDAARRVRAKALFVGRVIVIVKAVASHRTPNSRMRSKEDRVKKEGGVKPPLQPFARGTGLRPRSVCLRGAALSWTSLAEEAALGRIWFA